MENKPEKKTKAISIELPADLYDLLHNFSIATERTKKVIVTNAIREYIEECS